MVSVSVLVASFVVVGAGAAEAWRLTHPAPDTQYRTAAISVGAIAKAVTGSGTVNPVTTVQVGSYVSGVIQEISCDYNTKVTKGQLCAKIDPRPYQTVVDQEAANLAAAEAQLEKDQTSLKYATVSDQRSRDLWERGIVSQDAEDSADSVASEDVAQVNLDESTVVQRQALLNAAQVNLGYTNIVSPVDGTVVSRNVTVGQTVAASFQTPTLFLIATDLANMQVDVNVSESDIGGISVGNPASFTVEAFPDTLFTGRVTEVRQAPQSVQNVITYDVVVSAPNPDLLLKPGMTATTRIVTSQREGVMRVPTQALRYSPGGLDASTTAKPASADAHENTAPPHVWIVRDGRPVSVTVTLGLENDSFAEITSGDVKPGDQVIVSESGPHAAAESTGRLPAFRP
jgi:HlyD family secretion protein